LTLAENGEQALLHLQHSDFDLLLIDITMPVLDGLETTRQLRQLDRNQHIPVIALTAHALPEYQQQAKAAGMSGFLHKPFEYEELHQAMMQALAITH
jgi:Response regulator containing a CheY-like receiver domain and a GGDEF domain